MKVFFMLQIWAPNAPGKEWMKRRKLGTETPTFYTYVCAEIKRDKKNKKGNEMSQENTNLLYIY